MNGYGPEGKTFTLKILNFFLNFITKKIGFKKSNANLHDTSYSIGGTEADRIRADTGFLRYLLIDSNGVFYKIILAYLFYFSVRLFGGKYFHYKNGQKE